MGPTGAGAGSGQRGGGEEGIRGSEGPQNRTGQTAPTTTGTFP